MIKYFLFFSVFFILGCKEQKNKTLPIYGEKEFIPEIDKDTVYHTIPFWSFYNQDSVMVTSEAVNNSVYIVDFFFTHCPGICPELLENFKKVQKDLKNENITLVSFTVNPKDDTVERLKWYAQKNNINTNNWHFLTGDKQEIYELGINGFLVPNQEDVLAPGGFLHSEKFILIDTKGRIRGMYNGRDEKEVNQLIADTKTLLHETN